MAAVSLDFDLIETRARTEQQEAIGALRALGHNSVANRLEAMPDPDEADPLFAINITHNLVKMAQEAGIYACLWRPDENGITGASDLIAPLRKGLLDLDQRPEHYQQFNPANGWGDYYGFKAAVRAILGACEDHPGALVRVSR